MCLGIATQFLCNIIQFLESFPEQEEEGQWHPI